MAVRAGAAPASPIALGLDTPTVQRLLRWLLVAVGLDLLLTRFLVRMAIFVPKGEPWSTLAAGLGRVGAAADAIVPIVGVLLLMALLARAGRSGGALERATLVGLALVAAGGFALLAFPPTPPVAVALEGLVVAVALGSVWLVAPSRGMRVLARAGFGSLAASVALAAVARALTAAAQVGAPEAAPPGGLVPVLAAAGETAFVIGAALVGLAGVRVGLALGSGGRRWHIVGVVVGLVIVLAAGRSPAMWGALEIWSIGLTGVVPPIVLAMALGLATAGLPILARRTPEVAIGIAIVLLAGFGLAASGLVLAGLLGLVVAGLAGAPPERAGNRRAPARVEGSGG